MTKRKIIIVSWLLLFFATIALFVYAGEQKKSELCKGIKVEIVGKKEYVFVNEEQIKNIVASNGGRVGYIKDSINLQKIEKVLYKDVWVKKADVFFDNHNILQVRIDQSDPIARIFTQQGETFYIDSTEKYLPVNSKVTTRLPVFTSFPQNGLDDSLLITDIKNLSMFINRDTFWSSMISQLNVINKNEFEIVPVVGNHLVYIGTANELNDKFNKLYSFYKQVMVTKGLDKYKKIDVQYNGQVVATLRDSTKRNDAVFGIPVNLYDSTFLDSIAVDSVKIKKKPVANTQKNNIETGNKKLAPAEAIKPQPATTNRNRQTNNNN